MLLLLGSTAVLAAAAVGMGGKAVYPVQKISPRGIERIQIVGVRGDVRLTGGRGPYHLRVRHSSRRTEDWNLLVERRGSTLVIEVGNVVLGREWRRLVKREQWPEFDIDLTGPSRPVTISWRDGGLAVNQWSSDLDASFLSGTVSICGGRGSYHVQTMRGGLTVSKFNGSLQVQGGYGPVSLSDVGGQLKINWMQGEFQARRVNAKVNLESQDLKADMRDLAGTWSVHSVSGRVDIRQLAGQFRGSGEDTVWNIAGGRTSELEVVSAKGPVQVDWQAPARVFLASRQGEISSPHRVEDRDGTRVSKGQKGVLSLGQVFVRTHSGDIAFKY